MSAFLIMGNEHQYTDKGAFTNLHIQESTVKLECAVFDTHMHFLSVNF